MTTRHSIERMADRIGQLHLAESEYLAILARALKAARTTEDGSSVAALVEQLERSYKVVTPDGRESKGDQVWVICRSGDFVTVMLRNHTQPMTTQKMRVDRIVKVN